ncbi:hypothetical protein B0H13DRAFT_2327886 [Mycena leptocephala]|nr:hypothetical protein B0H13DRAFT_2327886 [Mycena leptocephala]
MVPLNKLGVSLLVPILYGSSVLALPLHATHRVRTVGRGLQLNTFHPQSTYETFGEGIVHPLWKPGSHVGGKDFRIHPVISRGRGGHCFIQKRVRRMIDGIPVENAVVNVAFNNCCVRLFLRAYKYANVSPSAPTVPLEDAIAAAEEKTKPSTTIRPLWSSSRSDGSLRLTHVVQIQNEVTAACFKAFVDAHSGELLSVTDFVARVSCLVLPLTKEILTQGFQILTNPQDLTGGLT